MKKILFLFPNQLFASHPEINSAGDEIVLIEDELFFKDHQYPLNFHKKKLILHRASMQQYADQLAQQGYTIHYIDWNKHNLAKVFERFSATFTDSQLVFYDAVDFVLEKRLNRYCKKHSLAPLILQSPLFLNSDDDNKDYRSSKKRWFMADFYQDQRKRLKILVEDNKPVGGKWSFDEENRKKIPKKELNNIPEISYPKECEQIKSARAYVLKNFPDALGNADNFEYPISHPAAEEWLDTFLSQRFTDFGRYEDALVPQQGWLYHSILTPIMNIGLLSPQLVIDKTLAYAENNDIPLNSLEGFIRQIIGWREFMRATYVDLGVKMRTTNHWQHTRKIPDSFYHGSTGIKPIDDVINRTLESGYCHHIERLMVLGGFMFLCEFDPDEIYNWFMELFIDSYDWVMVPNVYAMSQHADGGQITTKPYFSGSSYLKKMGYDDFDKQGGDWCEVWDGLYWRWINLHQAELSKNPRWAMMCAMARKMDTDKMNTHMTNAEDFLKTLLPS